MAIISPDCVETRLLGRYEVNCVAGAKISVSRQGPGDELNFAEDMFRQWNQIPNFAANVFQELFADNGFRAFG